MLCLVTLTWTAKADEWSFSSEGLEVLSLPIMFRYHSLRPSRGGTWERLCSRLVAWQQRNGREKTKWRMFLLLVAFRLLTIQVWCLDQL